MKSSQKPPNDYAQTNEQKRRRVPSVGNPPSSERLQKRGAVIKVTKHADLQTATTETEQQIFDLDERLHRSGWVINCRRQGFDSNIHEQVYRIFGILLECTFGAKLNRSSQWLFRKRADPSSNSKNRRRVQNGITNGGCQLNGAPGPTGDFYQGRHVNRLDDLRVPVMRECLKPRSATALSPDQTCRSRSGRPKLVQPTRKGMWKRGPVQSIEQVWVSRLWR